MHKIASLFVFGCLLVVLGHVNSVNGETVGERFDKAIKEIAKQCDSRKLEPNEVCGEVAKLKPADPLATEEGRFAHSIKIPNPVPEDSGYKRGMTPEQYFDHLCKTEAGEFIYKTVENVEGLYMMRPRKEATDYELEHLYALEDPYISVTGHDGGETSLGARLFLGMAKYQFFEQPMRKAVESVSATKTYHRYSGYDGKNRQTLKGEEVNDLRSLYGYTWRGLNRPHDREMGIVGGELIVLDLQTEEVLAVRRGYIRSGNVRNLTGFWWLTGQICPKGRPSRPDFYTYDFIGEVLKPKQ
ncbi:MAG: hypothetical protein ABI955_14010 [Nitrospirota bacterium]